MNDRIKPSKLSDSLGWLYRSDIPQGDARKIVSLQQSGMEWVGIRIWNATEQCWYNGNEPLRSDERVLAWMDLPATARRHWVRGKLLPENEQPTEEDTP